MNLTKCFEIFVNILHILARIGILVGTGIVLYGILTAQPILKVLIIIGLTIFIGLCDYATIEVYYKEYDKR